MFESLERFFPLVMKFIVFCSKMTKITFLFFFLLKSKNVALDLVTYYGSNWSANTILPLYPR